ncbi:UAA transporter [Cantharellus anzutake]|uniref:UAA transporter n=1 Tax=Cantharellus anzutake TaxID=1750568 RepID=UPI0019056772|nr:UAA transporter [Cantharellus anzutake]KAF8316968.1 UAA transporter [Cantharellus anzutake]
MTNLLPLVLATTPEWLTILGLIFGGCCSNALTLEYATSHNPRSGSLITFAQFVLVSLFGLRKRFIFIAQSHDKKGDSNSMPRVSLIQRIKRVRIKPLAVPLRRWAIQVILYLGISLLNNYAFKYRIPMAVHIIFRSGGPVVNMIIGYVQRNKRYPRLQVAAVVLVSAGIAACTAPGAQGTKPRVSTTSSSIHSDTYTAVGAISSHIEYSLGIGMLALALVLSQYLGFSQEETNKRYGRGHWEEGMFFLHFLSLPMFFFVREDLIEQIKFANASEPVRISESLYTLFAMPMDFVGFAIGVQGIVLPSFTSIPWPPWLPTLLLPPLSSLTIPYFWVPLILNVLTHTICVSGVNRLTARVDSLTVTLTLTVRKAASLIISVVLVGRSRGNIWLWGGSTAVLLGSVLYTYGGDNRRPREELKAE